MPSQQLIRSFLALLGLLAVSVSFAQRGTTRRVSVSSEGEQANGRSFECSVSGDGRYVAFWSWATNLVQGDTNGVADVFVYDRLTHQTTRVSVNSLGEQGNSGSVRPSISADGRYVAFYSGATNFSDGDTKRSA